MSSGPDPQPLPNVPIIHRPGETASAPLKRAPLADRKRLLIVDDEMPILRLVTRILSTENYEIMTASSGEEAEQMMAQHGFPGVDLLVTDLLMPGINGRELANLVRMRFPKTRVLFVTGFADTLFKGLPELGEGESFIEKPFGTDGLLEATRLLMFGHISEDQDPPDARNDPGAWSDRRVRARIVRFFRKLRMA